MVDLEFPVFVRAQKADGARVVYARPLFWSELEVQGTSLEDALSQLQRRCVKVIGTSGELAPVMWLSFDPELHLVTHTLSFRFAGAEVRAPILIGHFVVNGQVWGVFPKFNGHIFWVGDAPITVAASEELERLSRELSRKMDTSPDLALVRSEPGELVERLQLHMSLPRSRFDFEALDFISLFMGAEASQKFSGAREIEKVAEDLLDYYPHHLQRATEPIPLVPEISQALFGPTPNALVVLGAAGTGRTTLIHEAYAQYLAQWDEAPGRATKIWHLDPGRVIAGMSLIGAWQRRAEAIFSHIEQRRRGLKPTYGPDVLYVSAPVSLCHVGRSAGSNLTLSAVLRPWIEAHRIPVVIEATPEEWQRVEELDRPFADLFHVLRISPCTRPRALRILGRQRSRLERQTGCTFSAAAVRRLVEMEDRFPTGVQAPGSFVERLTELTAILPNQSIGPLDVERAFATRTGLRPALLDLEQPLKDDALRAELRRKLIGQPEAIDALAATIHTLRAGMQGEKRPVCTMMFVGPTGVGKTEAARVLANTLYVDPSALVRLDMNEFIDAGAALRLVGDLHRPDGLLSSRVRHRPFCVLLLDEIEKAHPIVHDLLLQVLDEGRLTDGLGRRVDFTHCVIVLTSNVGAREVARQSGFRADPTNEKRAWHAALEKAFRPEFLNRIDRIVTFQPLERAAIRTVADLQLSRLLAREGFLRRMLVTSISDDCLDWIAEEGYDGRMGARALKRVIEARLSGPVAAQLATLPVEQAAYLHIFVQPGVNGRELVAQIEPLSFIPPLPPAAERSAAERLPDLTAEIETLEHALAQVRPPQGPVAWAGPEGSFVQPGAELWDLLHSVRRQVHELSAESGALQQFVPKLATYRQKARGYNRKINPQELGSHLDLRAWLSSMRVPDPSSDHDVDTLMWDLDLLKEGINALTNQGAPSVAVVLRAAGRRAWGESTPCARLAELYESALSGRARPISPKNGSWDRDYVVICAGYGLDRLLRAEQGVHLFVPAGDAPLGVLVDVLPFSGEEPNLSRFPARKKGDTAIIRMYAIPSTPTDPGSITDLRSGQTLSWRAGKVQWLRWLLDAAPEGA